MYVFVGDLNWRLYKLDVFDNITYILHFVCISIGADKSRLSTVEHNLILLLLSKFVYIQRKVLCAITYNVLIIELCSIGSIIIKFFLWILFEVSQTLVVFFVQSMDLKEISYNIHFYAF